MTASTNSVKRFKPPARRAGKRGGRSGSGDLDGREPVLPSGGFVQALLAVAFIGLCGCLAVYLHLLRVEASPSGSPTHAHLLRGLSAETRQPSIPPATSPTSAQPKVQATTAPGVTMAQKEPAQQAPQQQAPQQQQQPPQQEAAPLPPLPADPNCKWEVHQDAFLGEFAEVKPTEYDLPLACKICSDLQDGCVGITCVSKTGGCSPRRGVPYLAKSPSGEVSYTKTCKGSKLSVAGSTDLQSSAPSNGTFPGGFPVGRSTDVQQPSVDKRRPLGKGRLGLVIIAHNQPECLQKCLASIASQPQEDLDAISLAVSLDDPPTFQRMEDVLKQFGPKLTAQVWHKPLVTSSVKHYNLPVSKISEHFKFALTQAFSEHHFEYAIFLENDLTAAPDFIRYFRVAGPLLEEDPTLFCVSAWNDNGFKGIVSNERRLFRTDYFPGLGWMVRNETWEKLKNMWPRFPSTGWDHWLRHGSGLHPRECVVPEVPRTHHFGTHGANVKKGSQLARMLDNMALSALPPGALGDLSYLLHDAYEEQLLKLLRDAPLVHPANAEVQAAKLSYGQLMVVPYTRETYKDLAKRLKISAMQPRTGHRGIVFTRHQQSQAVIALVDRRRAEGVLPDSEQWKPHPERVVSKAQPGQSCDNLCAAEKKHCDPAELEFVNNCEEMKKAFPCEDGCGHQVGQEIPAYVHDKTRDTALQCLVTDDAIPSCAAKVPVTTRLCVCTPL